MSRENRLGRGIRFGIAEQNMADDVGDHGRDTLPGGFRPMTAFASYGVFSVMMANAVRMSLISNEVNPDSRGFFILLAAHDGPETGEDGPTHHGLFWMSLYSAYPGIKVYKPLDANEAVEMLFHAAGRGEPVAFSVVRPPVPVFRRGNGVPPAIEAVNGAYVFKQYANNGKRKLRLVVCGGQVMANVLAVLPEFENDADIKIVAATSPELFEELRRRDPQKAAGDSRRRRARRGAGIPQRMEGLPVSVPAVSRLREARIRHGRFLAIRQPEGNLPGGRLRPRRAARRFRKMGR